jgi:hypothetical protein
MIYPFNPGKSPPGRGEMVGVQSLKLLKNAEVRRQFQQFEKNEPHISPFRINKSFVFSAEGYICPLAPDHKE